MGVGFACVGAGVGSAGLNWFFFFQAEDGIRDYKVTGVQTCALPIYIQRGGPSTGMPTNVEQSDLNIACFGGHGDSTRVVLAPANVEDCFYTAIEAVNIADRKSVV